MATVSLTIRVLLLLAPFANFAGHVRADNDVLRSAAELNRCLTAARVALTRRGVANLPASPSSIRAGLGTRPAGQI
jgi:hypothetical protein